ncbi:MAG TPA: hypothetical protein VKF37_18950 [Chloroflexota bacterium]|nr:hypothetical protein [Chloroflexota bacterium]
MAVEPVTLREAGPPAVCDDGPRVSVPPAFYRDDEPPEPPAGDPHWREFPFCEGIKGSRLLVAGIVLGVLFVTLAHLAVLLFI